MCRLRAIYWRFLEERFGAIYSVYSDGAGHPPAADAVHGATFDPQALEHMHNLFPTRSSPPAVLREQFFRHKLVFDRFDRSSLTR